MKKATRILHIIPGSLQALKVLLTAVPRITRLIFRKRSHMRVMSTDPGEAGKVSIRRTRVIQFNAFLRIEKNKITNINNGPRLDPGV
jgi:hypothetical protein